MTTATLAEPKVWTTDDLLAMPDDGTERWIIDGKLREKPSEFPGATMTVRNRHHSELLINIGTALKLWTRSRPQPRGKVYGGEAGVHLFGVRESTVGVDLVYAPPEVVAVQSDDETTLLDGVPTLVVEILSPNDTIEHINEKVAKYLTAGVAVVWVVEPYRRDVMVFSPGQTHALYTLGQTVPEHPAMPGFAPSVAELFE